MFEKIPAPVKGQPARASWGAALTSRVNELCAMAPARGLARDGLTGSGYEALPQNHRERRTAYSPGCWNICIKKSGEGESQKVYTSLENRYYSIGEVTAHMDEDVEINLDQYINQGELAEGEEYTNGDRPFIAIKAAAAPDDTGLFPEPEIVAYKTFEEMAEAQGNTAFVVRPIYKLSHIGKVVVDFRSMPHLQLVEVL